MAIWQASFFIVPKRNKDKFEKERFKDEAFIEWGIDEFNDDIFEYIPEGLNETKSWSDDIRQFGEYDESLFQFSYYIDHISISLRLDLRSLSKKTLNEVIFLVQKLEGVIVDSDLTLVGNDKESLISYLKASNANRFLRDPRGFLNSLG